MCGIFGVMCNSGCSCACGAAQTDLRQDQWSRRGPDSGGSWSDGKMLLAACVLHQRGREPVGQPLASAGGRVLLWNGELYCCGHQQLPAEASDTEFVGRHLSAAGTLEELLTTVAEFQGPRAFLYYAPDLGCTVFGRDLFGRRSLLLASSDNHVLWSSIAMPPATCPEPVAEWEEVPACGVFVLLHSDSRQLRLHEYRLHEGTGCRQLAGLCVTPQSPIVPSLTIDSKLANCPTPGSATDSASKLANCPTPGSATDSAGGPESQVLPANGFDLEAIAPVHLLAEVNAFSRLLSESVGRRIRLSPGRCRRCQLAQGDVACTHSAVSFLFSGGVDSALIAAIAARQIPEEQSIDLLNVAFEKPSTKANRRDRRGPTTATEPAAAGFDVPDRISGVHGVAELRRLFPARRFNFVTIDVSLAELQDARRQRVSRLCCPGRTVLDDSLGCAVWFAARGRGTLPPELNPHLQGGQQLYESPAKVVLCGMGADEQLCGYSRHRQVNSRGGCASVASELAMELRRIGHRNLGRDDRMVSDHGKEARFPYLDEQLVQHLANLPPCRKADLGQRPGLGDKLLLRVAAWRLGLTEAALRPKRAMQFGSRIAKCESSSERGHQLCDRLLPLQLLPAD